MKLHKDVEGVNARNPVITIGMFDGVHLGHTKILERIISKAKSIGGESVLLSFWPHPRILFEGADTKLRILSTIEEKARLLEQIGIDHFIVYPFSQEFAQTPPEVYVENILVKNLKAHTIVVGYDHKFGFKGAGNYNLMQILGNRHGFKVEQIEVLEVEQINVSSTKIRQALEQGDIKTAANYLSYNYTLEGEVVKGNQIGRELGYPTANILPISKYKLIPQNGIYIIRIFVNNLWHKAVLSIGIRPTIENIKKERTIEAFIFNFNENIYGQKVRVEFLRKIRDELKFDSLDELKEQIKKDVQVAEQYFENK